jgi:hypothetical protein
MVQAVPPARVAVQVPPAPRLNRPVKVAVRPVNAAAPELVTVTWKVVLEALVVLIAVFGNTSVAGATVTAAAAEAKNSTAPASTKPFPFLALPKKSVAGARVKAPRVPFAVDGMRLMTDEVDVGA